MSCRRRDNNAGELWNNGQEFSKIHDRYHNADARNLDFSEGQLLHRQTTLLDTLYSKCW